MFLGKGTLLRAFVQKPGNKSLKLSKQIILDFALDFEMKNSVQIFDARKKVKNLSVLKRKLKKELIEDIAVFGDLDCFDRVSKTNLFFNRIECRNPNDLIFGDLIFIFVFVSKKSGQGDLVVFL
jgi:hypothetical protein